MAVDPPLFIEVQTGDTPPSYDGPLLRSMISALAPIDGVTHKNDLKVTQRGSGANMSVDVAAGQCAITGNSISYQGTYLCRSTSTVNVAISAAPGSGTRTDLIVAKVHDKSVDGGSTYAWSPEVITGWTGTALTNAIPLASVAVITGHSSIVTSNITDLRLANILSDIPMWELTGGNGQAVPTGGAGVTYTGWTFSDMQFVDTNGNAGEIVIRQPGRYPVSYTARIDIGGDSTAERICWIDHLRGGSFYRRIGAQNAFPSGLTTDGLVQTASGTARCQAGDVLRARSAHACGVTLHLDDVHTELGFSGFYAGP